MALAEGSGHIIPETLLALAKDERYVRQCDELIQNILGGDSQHYRKAGKGLAWLLYAVLVVRRTNKTLGMEFCGLKVDRGRRLWMFMALSAISSMGVDLYFRTQAAAEEGSQDQSEALRGQARRDFFEAQRRAMLQRATNPSFSSNANNQQQQQTPQRSQTPSRLQVVYTKLQELVKQTVQELSSSTMIEEGPHALPNSTHSAALLAKWILRFSLVHFCLKGNFPVWNLLGINIKNEAKKQGSGNLLANRPNLHRFVALLMLQQVAATVVRGSVQFLTRLWIRRQQELIDVVGAQRHLQESGAIPLRHDNDALASSTQNNSNHDLVCGICKLPRSHPAVPKACGHVFCWPCLYQWTHAQRPECPLCRAPCRPQEILPLYYYRP